jgi:hypothetical protein
LLLYCAIKQKARAAVSGWANVGTPEAFKSNAKTIHVSGNKMLSTREKNRRSNLDFTQLIALNVGDFILGCKFGRRTRVPFERWPETRAHRILTGQGHKTEWFWFLITR